MEKDLFEFILLAMSVAGVAVVWRNVLENSPKLKNKIKNIFGFFDKILLCGSCFTYWLALASVIWVRPIEFWQPFDYYMINIFSKWMALAWLAVFLRFLYVLIQELVSEKVHGKDYHTH